MLMEISFTGSYLSDCSLWTSDYDIKKNMNDVLRVLACVINEMENRV